MSGYVRSAKEMAVMFSVRSAGIGLRSGHSAAKERETSCVGGAVVVVVVTAAVVAGGGAGGGGVCLCVGMFVATGACSAYVCNVLYPVLLKPWKLIDWL